MSKSPLSRRVSLSLLLTCLALVATGCLVGVILVDDADLTKSGSHNAERYGYKVHSTGDMNGDGWNDFVVTAPMPGHDKTYIYFGPHEPVPFPAQDPPPRLVFKGRQGGEAGWSVTSGRLSGAHNNLVVGAPSEFGGKGIVYILKPTKPVEQPKYGDATIDHNSAYAQLKGAKGGEYAGWDVAVGDFNGDNKDDLLVGACHDDDGAGAVYIVHGPIPAGQHDLAQLAHARIKGNHNQDSGLFGCAVAAVDLDNDGQDEVVVGAHQEKIAGAQFAGWGRTHIFYDVAPGVHNTSELLPNHAILEGAVHPGNFGFSLAGGSDLNGDGTQDLAIGAPSYFCHNQFDNAPPNQHCANPPDPTVFVITGKPGQRLNGVLQISNTASAIITDDVFDSGFGTALSTSGDVNNDHISELLIGTQGKHKAFLYYGDKSLGSGQLELTSEQAHATFDGSAKANLTGMSVSLSPDLNHDGVGDLIIGAPDQEWFSGPHGQDPGNAYIFYGEEQDDEEQGD